MARPRRRGSRRAGSGSGVVALAAALVAISCARPEPVPALEEALDAGTVVEDVRAMFEAYFAAIEAGGLTAEFDYLDDSDAFFWVPPGYTSALSYDSVRAILEANAPGYRSIRYGFERVRVIPLTDEIATYTGIVRGTLVDTTGAESGVALIESGTVVKRADGWKLLSGQTAALPGREAP